MPAGVPVAAVAIGGGRNAGILAAEIIATFDRAVQEKLLAYKAELAEQSRAKNPLPAVGELHMAIEKPYDRDELVSNCSALDVPMHREVTGNGC